MLKDRSEEAPAAAPPSGPSTDDDWYGKGMRFEPTW
ncbi:MAG: hypothetical protein QOI78_1631 [Actinomycetota bacterium]|nr:hypothetical protein [Actinomycetota bacterium]